MKILIKNDHCVFKIFYIKLFSKWSLWMRQQIRIVATVTNKVAFFFPRLSSSPLQTKSDCVTNLAVPLLFNQSILCIFPAVAMKCHHCSSQKEAECADSMWFEPEKDGGVRKIKTEKFLQDCPADGKNYTICRKIDQNGKSTFLDWDSPSSTITIFSSSRVFNWKISQI